jgi:hypothetical protein
MLASPTLPEFRHHLGRHPAPDQLKNPEHASPNMHDRNTVGFNENAGGIA